MTHRRDDTREGRAARLLADAGWDRVRDRILGGVCHDLNGRITSLEALGMLAREGDVLGPESLRHDLERLSELVRVLRPLSEPAAPDPAPVMLQDLAAQALELARRAGGAWADAEVAVSEPVLPVRLHEVDTLKALVTLFATLVCELAATPATPSVRIEGDEASVRLEVALPAGVPDHAHASLEPLAELFARDGGCLSTHATGVAVTWPSLAALRARRTTL